MSQHVVGILVSNDQVIFFVMLEAESVQPGCHWHLVTGALCIAPAVELCNAKICP